MKQDEKYKTYVADIGNNILVGFDWPISDNDLESKEIISNLNGLYKKIFNSPKQVAVAIEWVSKQYWAEDGISIIFYWFNSCSFSSKIIGK